MAPADLLRVEVVFCPRPGRTESCALQLPAGALMSDALQASGLLQRHGLQLAALKAGIWSRVQELSTPLRDQDRVEIYRPLQVDPKEARRLRYKRDRGSKGQPAPAKAGKEG
jgi:putative ubiquitin-RnfH superfamily antitoxin RatB of RatAB toxin-antitoxin module